ncbi:hypothetical protein Bca52824_033298 [Brassica carinata]|uniref:Uncharacterized protein n=1 Tax=Brassica carinata TaxID=52824 RepID=A0A8X7SER4_BRACI|nr:hypothetical protein Bca52824_033298 [Brassica carinata]
MDRHGRPFRDRVSSAWARFAGPRNKLAPPEYQAHPLTPRNKHEVLLLIEIRERNFVTLLHTHAVGITTMSGAPTQQRQSGSPRPSLGRNLDLTDFPPPLLNPEAVNASRERERHSPRLQWRAISPNAEQEATSCPRHEGPTHTGAETAVVLPDPSMCAPGQTREMIMEELNVAALQYVNEALQRGQLGNNEYFRVNLMAR